MIFCIGWMAVIIFLCAFVHCRRSADPKLLGSSAYPPKLRSKGANAGAKILI